MSLSRVVGFEFPADFDTASFDAVNDQVASIANPNDLAAPWKKNAWFNHGAAWNGLAYRLRSAVEYNEEFGRLIALSTSPPPDERYSQERALFGCIASSLSAIDCFYMATYCVATALSPEHFQLRQEEHLNKTPREIADAYHAWQPSDEFSKLLSNVAKSDEYKKLKNLRNALAHRGTLPRQHFFSTVSDVPSAIPSNPKALGGDFDYTASLSDATTSIHTQWLCHTASQLVSEFNRFLVRHPQGERA